jgi:hypothetical protein
MKYQKLLFQIIIKQPNYFVKWANAISVGTKNNFKQEQKNTCSSFADCINSGTVTFGLDGGHTRP